MLNFPYLRLSLHCNSGFKTRQIQAKPMFRSIISRLSDDMPFALPPDSTEYLPALRTTLHHQPITTSDFSSAPHIPARLPLQITLSFPLILRYGSGAI